MNLETLKIKRPRILVAAKKGIGNIKNMFLYGY
jgi:hypothetical protein